MTGRESRGGVRGLAGLPWAAAEVPKGYFSIQDVSPEKCGVLTPSWASQPIAPEPGKEARYHPAVKSSRVPVYQGEMSGEAESLLKGQRTKFCLQPLNPGLQQREGRVDQRCMRGIW